MKRWLIQTAAYMAVALTFLTLGKHGDSLAWGQETLLLIAGFVLFQVLFIPRWPRAAALRQVFQRTVPGRHIDAEVRISRGR